VGIRVVDMRGEELIIDLDFVHLVYRSLLSC
jgi:hypothetical protein